MPLFQLWMMCLVQCLGHCASVSPFYMSADLTPANRRPVSAYGSGRYVLSDDSSEEDVVRFVHSSAPQTGHIMSGGRKAIEPREVKVKRWIRDLKSEQDKILDQLYHVYKTRHALKGLAKSLQHQYAENELMIQRRRHRFPPASSPTLIDTSPLFDQQWQHGMDVMTHHQTNLRPSSPTGDRRETADGLYGDGSYGDGPYGGGDDDDTVMGDDRKPPVKTRPQDKQSSHQSKDSNAMDQKGSPMQLIVN